MDPSLRDLSDLESAIADKISLNESSVNEMESSPNDLKFVAPFEMNL